MRAFSCGTCRSLVFFDNSVCITCGSALGWHRQSAALVVLSDIGGDFGFVDAAGRRYRRCAHRLLAECNWLADLDSKDGLCPCCQLTRTRPPDDDQPALAAFAHTEAAKRRLLFQLDSLGLPVIPRDVDPQHGLAFDLLSSARGPVVTGHNSGVITIDLAEGDDAHREARRVRLDEPYRTMLGHLRHEIGHWYWDVLVSGTSWYRGFQERFGDERADYAAALKAHYDGATTDSFTEQFVSHYASAHPWEDWAETFAHYLHIRDTLQTAAAWGVAVTGPDLDLSVAWDARLEADPAEDLARDNAGFDGIIRTWLPLTYALNAVNRSMGKDDLYPFVLSPTVVGKLAFVHAVVQQR